MALAVYLSLSGCAAPGGTEEGQARAAERFEAAVEASEAGRLEEAADRLERLCAAHPGDPYARRALLEHAYVAYRLGVYDEASSRVDTYLEGGEGDEVPADERRYALYLRAAISHARWDEEGGERRDTGLARRAFGDYRQLVERFPESRRAERALERMEELRTEIAAEELARARRRLSAGIYAEAAERAAWIAEQYPAQPAAPEALAVQAKALERLGRGEEAAATRRMLEIKHPDYAAP